MGDLIDLFGETSEDENINADKMLSNITLNDCSKNVLIHKKGIKKLPPERHNGNVEYKVELKPTNNERLEQLTTQMKWRLKEGKGIAFYELGVTDSGHVVGLTPQQSQSTLNALKSMADKLNSTISIVFTYDCEPDQSDDKSKQAYRVMVRQNTSIQTELRLAVLGNTSVGKSTLVSVLCGGQLDDGKGSSRLSLFRHRHEVQTGRTSCIKIETLGFDANGQPLNGNSGRWLRSDVNMGNSIYSKSLEEICQNAHSLVTFIDLAGYFKYLKTTVFGLTRNQPHMVLLLVNANRGIESTTVEHLSLIVAQKLPFWVVINKCDLIDGPQLTVIQNQIDRMIRQHPTLNDHEIFMINDQACVDRWCKLFDESYVHAPKMVPVLNVSCTTGQALNWLCNMLFVQVTTGRKYVAKDVKRKIPVFQVNDIFHNNVVAGLMCSGQFQLFDHVIVGPDNGGHFHAATVKCVRKHNTNRLMLQAGDYGTIALKSINDHQDLPLRRGVVLLPINMQSNIQRNVCHLFKAQLNCLSLAGSVRKGFQATLYLNHIKQNVLIHKICGKFNRLVQGDRATVIIKFVRRPEFMFRGAAFLLREGPNKLIGKVQKLHPFNEQSPST